MKQNIWIILLFLSFSLIFHWRLFFPLSLYTSQDFGRGDLTHFNYPLKNYLREKLINLELPLWNENIYNGFPVFAEGQIGTFYLPNLVFFSLFPTPWAFNFSYVLLFFIAGLGAFYYCRFLNISRSAGLFAGICFSFSMYFVGHVLHLNLSQSASLSPWIILLSEKLTHKPSRGNFIWFSILLSQQIFSGYIQHTLYTLAVVAVLAVWRIITKEIYFKSFLNLSAGIITGLSLSAIQLVPSWEFFRESIRQTQLPAKYITLFPYEIKHLFLFFYPYLLGDPSRGTYSALPKLGIFWENVAYLGILPLVFAIFSLSKKYWRQNIIFSFLILLTLLYSLGWLKFILFLPPFSTFRVPQKSLVYTSLAIAVLGAIGYSRFMVYLRINKKIPNFLEFMIKGSLISFAFFNLYFIGSDYNGVLPAPAWLAKPGTAEYLDKFKNSSRIFAVGFTGNWSRVNRELSHGWRSGNAQTLLSTRANLDPNINLLFSLPSFDGYMGTITKNISWIESLVDQEVKENESNIYFSEAAEKLLSIYNVRSIISPKKITGTRLILATQIEEPNSQTTYYIYENPAMLPRIFFVLKLRQISTIDELKLSLNDKTTDTNNTAYITGNIKKLDYSKNVRIFEQNFSSSRVQFSVAAENEAFVVLADSMYPGWQAQIDGKPATIIPTNINSRGLIIPRGNHKVEYKYHPQSLINGFWVSILALAFLAGYYFKFPQD